VPERIQSAVWLRSKYREFRTLGNAKQIGVSTLFQVSSDTGVHRYKRGVPFVTKNVPPACSQTAFQGLGGLVRIVLPLAA
jgi:hypothetical protein